MSPIKFEENIKAALEKRTIKPAIGSWENLSKRLGPEEKKSKIKPFWWIGVAASFALVVWLTVDFISDTKVVTPTIVVAPEKTETPIEFKTITEETEEIIIAVVKEEKQEAIKPKKKVISIENPENYNQRLITETRNEVAVEKANIEKVTEYNSFEDQKVAEVVAQINEMKLTNKLVTDDEIEQLLKQAQSEIALQKLYNQNSRTVNANVLLSQVESEINKTFRDKVFDELKVQFNSVKNAVAQRND